MEALTTRLSRIIKSVKTVGEQQVATVRISLGTREGNEEVVENWKMFLDIVVKRVEETIDFELSEDTSDILNLEFVAKCEGRYSVSVNMYGVGVKGSPMVVDILCSEMRLYRNSKRWLYKLYKQKIINEFLAFNSIQLIRDNCQQK